MTSVENVAKKTENWFLPRSLASVFWDECWSDPSYDDLCWPCARPIRSSSVFPSRTIGAIGQLNERARYAVVSRIGSSGS